MFTGKPGLGSESGFLPRITRFATARCLCTGVRRKRRATSVSPASRPCARGIGSLDGTLVGDALSDKTKECIKLLHAKLHSQLVDGTPSPEIPLRGHDDVMPAFNVNNIFKPGRRPFA